MTAVCPTVALVQNENFSIARLEYSVNSYYLYALAYIPYSGMMGNSAAILDLWTGCQGLTTPNASPIETHVNCLNSAGRFHHFSPY